MTQPFAIGDLPIWVRGYINGVWEDWGPTFAYVDDPWTDVWLDVWLGRIVKTDHRLPAQTITITHGIPDEGNVADPTELSVELWNDDGMLTPGLYLLPDSTLNAYCPSWDENTLIQVGIGSQPFVPTEVTSIELDWPEGDDSTDDEPAHSSVQVEASGILRRLNQQSKPLRSPLTRLALANEGDVVGCWPFEDGSDSTSLSAGLLNFINPAGTITGFSMASDSTQFVGSDPLPRLSKGSNGSWSVAVPRAEAVGGAWRVDKFWYLSELPVDQTQDCRILDIASTGDVTRWTLDVVFYATPTPTTKLWLRGSASDGTLTIDQALPVVAFADDPESPIGQPVEFQLEVYGAGSWALQWIFQTDPINAAGISGTGAGTPGHPTNIGGIYANSPGDVVEGMLVVSASTLVGGWAFPANLGWPGETAGARIYRLCGEKGVPITIVGHAGTSTKLGIQKSGAFLDLLKEAAVADAGILHEPRGTTLGLEYRCRRSLYNQSPYLTLDASLGQIANPFTPKKDDQQKVNDQTVERIGGSSYRITTGEAKVYDASISLSLEKDTGGTLRNQAGWRLFQGRNDELRYAELTVDFGKMLDDTDDQSVIAALIEAWMGMPVGALVRVENLPGQHPAGSVDLIVRGWTVDLSPEQFVVTMNCWPASRFKVGKWGPGFSKWAPRNATLAGPITDTDTSIQVSTNGGILFTTDSGQYPFDFLMNGEQMTVTAGSGGTSPQAFTVVRGVNGVARDHADADPVRLVQTGTEGL